MRTLAKTGINKMRSFDKLCNQNRNFSRLTGIKLDEFLKIVEKVRPLWEKFQRKKKVSGRHSKIKTLEDEVLMLLIYYSHSPMKRWRL